MINRLLVSGCSFTDYCWSTWADYLSKEFDSFANVGTAGGDNATIARAVVDRAKAGDVAVILWSGFDRWSKYKETESYSPSNKHDTHWHHLGSIKSDKNFLVNHYHRVERFQTTIDYIQLVDLHSKVTGYTAYHFSAFPFLTGEIEKEVDPRILDIYKKYSITNNYLNEVSLFDYQIQNNQYILTTHTYHKNSKDNHPTPLTHWEYCNKVIAPKLNLTISTPLEEVMAEQNDLVVHGITRK